MLRYRRWIALGLLKMASGPTHWHRACAIRACLRTMLDQYLAAVIRHDPAAAPLVVGFRQTKRGGRVA